MPKDRLLQEYCALHRLSNANPLDLAVFEDPINALKQNFTAKIVPIS